MIEQRPEGGDDSAPQRPPRDGFLARAATRSAAVAERWFPNTLVFALLTVAVVAIAAMGIGSGPAKVASVFGNGFWDLIPFTMQMAMVAIGGFFGGTPPPLPRGITPPAPIPPPQR
ncbi:TIGR00366 family protein, partial [Streptomyces malaysiensis]